LCYVYIADHINSIVPIAQMSRLPSSTKLDRLLDRTRTRLVFDHTRPSHDFSRFRYNSFTTSTQHPTRFLLDYPNPCTIPKRSVFDQLRQLLDLNSILTRSLVDLYWTSTVLCSDAIAPTIDEI